MDDTSLRDRAFPAELLLWSAYLILVAAFSAALILASSLEQDVEVRIT
jgi:hypothetical protein